LSKDGLLLGQELNPRLPEYEAAELATRLERVGFSTETRVEYNVNNDIII
jgi:hypothetical protein